MTKQELHIEFAKAALTGLLAGPDTFTSDEYLAKASWSLALAMVAAMPPEAKEADAPLPWHNTLLKPHPEVVPDMLVPTHPNWTAPPAFTTFMSRIDGHDEIIVNGRRFGIIHEADEVSIFGMFDCHLFHEFKATSVRDLVEQVVEYNKKPHMNGDHDMGPVNLCPATVSMKGKRLREAGRMLFPEIDGSFNALKLAEYEHALVSDPDISRLLAQSALSKGAPNV